MELWWTEMWRTWLQRIITFPIESLWRKLLSAALCLLVWKSRPSQSVFCFKAQLPLTTFQEKSSASSRNENNGLHVSKTNLFFSWWEQFSEAQSLKVELKWTNKPVSKGYVHMGKKEHRNKNWGHGCVTQLGIHLLDLLLLVGDHDSRVNMHPSNECPEGQWSPRWTGASGMQVCPGEWWSEDHAKEAK